MKPILRQAVFFTLLFLVGYSTNINAQCLLGSTRDTLNWDYLDFLPNSGSYVAPTAYLTLAQSQTQRFTFGTQRVTINHNYSGANVVGDNTTHSGEVGTYGDGDDIRFKGNGSITVTFQNPVRNVQFSIMDVDRNQRVTVSSLSVVSLSTLAGSILTISNNNTVSARVDAAATTNIPNNANTPAANGTVNVDIAGPVTQFTIAVANTATDGSNEDGSFFISDISACSAGTFPMNYYNISKPFAGQGSYVICVRNDSIYYVNVANGKAKFLFADYGHNRINSLAYDPYRHMVYYAYSLSGPGGGASSTDRILRRYDYDMDTLGIVMNDVRVLGIPLYDQSIESGAAAFYGGSYYLGIEGGSGVSDRESAVWKIDFTSDGKYTPVGPASQVFAVPSNTHDWSDIGINDGILYDFDGSSSEDFYHKNLLTGECINYNPSPSSLVPRQTCVDWTGTMYNVGSASAIAAATIVPYIGNGMVNSTLQSNITFNGVAEVGSWGDAAEAFKPKTDYGDAPASYDPPGSDPGTHEMDDSLRLGNSTLIEWTKHTSADATGDGAEEDGLTGAQVISTGTSNFLIGVKVYNHTGANATLAGWIDKDKDGQFETGEGVSVTVPSSPSVQTVNLLWSSISVPFPPGTQTFMRLRITSTANGMTVANPTGFFDNGEIEDYLLTVVVVLPDQHIGLKAQKTNSNHVNLSWDVNDENGISSYELERSPDGSSWHEIATRSTDGAAKAANYAFLDTEPDMPVSYFRVKSINRAGNVKYSPVRKIDFKRESSIMLSPNPASSNAELNIQSANAGTARVSILDFSGRLNYDQTVRVLKGSNDFDLPVVKKLSNGVYKVRVQLNNEILISTLVLIK